MEPEEIRLVAHSRPRLCALDDCLNLLIRHRVSPLSPQRYGCTVAISYQKLAQSGTERAV